MKLSAVLIVKNETSVLDDCLNSVRGVDEIVVCDTGSSDNTVDMAKRHTDKVFEDYRWNDDFAEARNHALSKSSGDWILSIDADERLGSPVEEIRKEIAKAEELGSQALSCKLVTEAGDYHFFPRVTKRNIQWKGAIHNYVVVSNSTATGITIIRGYSEAHELDPDRALRILKKELEKNPEAVREKYYFAREHYYRRDFASAARWYEQYLRVGTWRPEVADAYLMLARCYWQLRQANKARAACLQAIGVNPDFREALRFMAEMHYSPWKEKWLQFAELAENTNVLFVRMPRSGDQKPLGLLPPDLAYFENVLLRHDRIDVLEWGAGYSTKYFTEFLTRHDIEYTWRAMEHQEKWYDAVRRWGLRNVEIVLADKDSHEYLSPSGTYDLIYVDGRNRVKCLQSAKKLLKPGGIVLLHDAERRRYHAGFEGYTWCFIGDGSPRLWRGVLD
ncbi:MAG: glycosyltransferase [Arenicellales bacterium]